MDNKDIIVRQAAKILELEDALSKKDDELKTLEKSRDFWYKEYQKVDQNRQGEANA